LLELLLVLAILGLLLGMTPPLLNKAFPVLKLRAAARDLVQEIQYVQNAAVIGNQVAEIAFDTGQGAYRSDWLNQGAVRHLPEGIGLALAPTGLAAADGAPVVRMMFYPDGSASGGQLYLGSAGRRVAIEVDWLTGRIRLDEAPAS
jgi:general secretion pathway protein H